MPSRQIEWPSSALLRASHEAPRKSRNTWRIRHCEGGGPPHPTRNHTSRGHQIRAPIDHQGRDTRGAPQAKAAPVKAILCTRHGTPDDLVLADIPDPVAGPGEVVAKVAAVGLNFFDTLIIAGKYQKKPPFPFSPWGGLAGTSEGGGGGVPGWAPGARVIGYCPWGAARDRRAVEAQKLVKLTADLDLARAAGLTITYGTGYHALIDRGRLKRGE